MAGGEGVLLCELALLLCLAHQMLFTGTLQVLRNHSTFYVTKRRTTAACRPHPPCVPCAPPAAHTAPSWPARLQQHTSSDSCRVSCQLPTQHSAGENGQQQVRRLHTNGHGSREQCCPLTRPMNLTGRRPRGSRCTPRWSHRGLATCTAAWPCSCRSRRYCSMQSMACCLVGSFLTNGSAAAAAAGSGTACTACTACGGAACGPGCWKSGWAWGWGW